MTTLREVMAKDPLVVEPEATVAEAAAVMVRGRVGSLLVGSIDDVVGILTERDVLRAAGSDGDLLATRVRDWMTREPTTAPPDEDTDAAIATMLDGGFRHLPVAEDDRVLGIVSLRDLLGRGVDGARPRGNESDTQDPAPESSPAPVRERRERMLDATRELQRRSRPPTGDVEAWRRELDEATDLVRDVLHAHVTETESPGGLFEELVRESGGRLQAGVRRLRREHERSGELLAELRRGLDAAAEPAALCQAADELLAQLEAHRHRGSDLLWQAHGVELGGRG